MVPKDQSEDRPVLDCSNSGLNAQLTPYGMTLPTIVEFLAQCEPHVNVGKRDFRHGFYHVLLSPASRKLVGFAMPGHPELLGRFRALPFGMS